MINFGDESTSTSTFTGILSFNLSLDSSQNSKELSSRVACESGYSFGVLCFPTRQGKPDIRSSLHILEKLELTIK